MSAQDGPSASKPPAATSIDRDVLRPNRARGTLHARFERHGNRTRAVHTSETGGLRLRFPRVIGGLTPDCEAVCINTGGGMVGGDSAELRFAFEPCASATLTTQSAEKVYRSEGALTTVDLSVSLAARACAEWLPQETILYDRAQLTRRLDVTMAADSTLLVVESLVFGRLAMGETVRSGFLHDRWRVRRDGRLVFADDLRMDGDLAALLDRPALGGGARAIANLLYVAPLAESMVSSVRTALSTASAEGGASAWNGLLSVRLLSPSPDCVRAAIVGVLHVLRGQAAPRVWQ